jgi:hypothetical protein
VDEVMAVVTLNAAALTALITLVAAGSSSSLAVVGVVVVAIGGTGGLVKVSQARSAAQVEASKAASKAAMQPVLQVEQCRTYSQHELDQLDHRSQRRRPIMIGNSMPMSGVSPVVGQPMNFPVDHGLKLQQVAR